MTVRHVAQRIPFRPNNTQKALLEQCFGARRFVYNQQVEAFDSYDRESNPVPKYPNVTDLKNRFPWLRDCPLPSNAMSQSIRDFAKAKGSYFRKARYEKNRPRFASRNDNIQSFRNCAPIRHMEGNRYLLSRKLGSVRIRKRDRLRYPIENLSSWTVKRENQTYYLTLLFDVDIQPMPKAEGRVGIDLGVKDLITLSTGEKIGYGDRLKKLETDVIRQQRMLSHRVKGSNRYRRQRLRLEHAYARLRHYRENMRHQLSHRLIEENQLVGLETLAVRNMVRKVKPKKSPDGRYMRNGQNCKRTLNRLIHRASWSGFVSKLVYKAEWYGRTLIQVGRFYPSSKLCHECGWKYKELKLSEREWTCRNCGTRHDRDMNAALNILAEAERFAAS